MTSSRSGPLARRLTAACFLVWTSLAAGAPAAGDTQPARASVRLRGTTLLRGTRAPLDHGTVIAIAEDEWKRSGLQAEHPLTATTDERGVFELTGLRTGRWHLIVIAAQATRFETDETFAARELVTVKYYLEPIAYSQSTFRSTVRADVNKEELSRVTLRTEELMKLPGSFGDALRALEDLPGVARAPFSSGLLIIRGAKPTDSRVYLSGGEVPQLYHFGGLRSVIPSELIDHVDYFPGNFSVRWGRAIGGAVDLDLRSPRRDRLHGSAEVNVFDAGAVVEGPLGKGGFFLAVRRSYVDALLAAVPVGGLRFESAPVYYDYQAALEYPLGPGRIRALVSGSDDQLKLVFDKPSDSDPLVSSFGTHIAYHRAQLRWTGALAGWQLFLQNSTGYTAQDGTVGRALNYSIANVGTDFRLEGRRKLGPRFSVLVGLDTQYARVHLSNHAPAAPREGQIISPVSASTLVETSQRFDIGNVGAFAELAWKPRESVTITGGLRFDYYSSIPLPSFDPRLTGRFQLARYTLLKVGVGLYSQPPAAIDFNAAYGNPELRPEKAIHTSVSVEQGLWRGLQLEVGGFYKHLYDLAAPSSEHTIRNGIAAPERVASIGVGRIYGGELLLRQQLSKYLFGWVSYTLMRSQRRDCRGCALRTFDFDQTHVLIVAAHAYLPRGFEVGLRFRYITGYPQTRPYGGFYDADADVYNAAQGPVNTGRLASFHSLDLRADKTFVFKKWVLKVYVDVTNVYNRRNEEVAQLSYDYTRSTPVKGLPLIPSFGIRGEF